MSQEHEIVIIGSGFAGLGLAIRLKQAGRDDFLVVSRDAEVGGTWWENTYPGCACDVPSRLYSFSFAQNPAWTRAFSPQPEILAYLRGCADRYGLRRHLRLNTEVTGMTWSEETARWTVHLGSGETVTARFVVSAIGGLSRPAIPDLPGLKDFRGKVFHSQRWDHSFPLAGQRVAVVGTGASAIQFVPQIAPKVAQLHLFQRTPPWVIPRLDRGITRFERWLYRLVPALMLLPRLGIYLLYESRLLAFTKFFGVLRLAQRVARLHLARQVPDPALRQKLTPDYLLGCKRILLSDDYFPSLTRPNVELVTAGIARFTATGVVTTDGVERPLDCVILGTGFAATDPLGPVEVRGRGGRTLREAWSQGMTAYLGTTVAGFPNLFLLSGPNTGIGHTSLLFMIESQLTYVLDALEQARRGQVRTVEVRSEVQDAFVAALDERSKRSVWMSGGCRSWYLDAQGRNRTLWPDFTWKFRWLTRRFDAGKYRVEPG